MYDERLPATVEDQSNPTCYLEIIVFSVSSLCVTLLPVSNRQSDYNLSINNVQ